MSIRPHILLGLGLLTVACGGCADDGTTADIRLPPGFAIAIYADEVPDARSLALGEKGTLFVGTRSDGRVFAVRDEDGDYRAERRWTLARDLDMPNGVAFRDGALYVAESGRILRFDDIEARLDAPPAPVVVARLPAYRHHGWRYIGFGPDDRLYVALGAPCNVCDPGELGVIVRMRPDGTERQIFARGVRNSVGFDWQPDSGDLWFTDNGRDWLGDDLPPDELNRASRPGLHFGFPWCHGGDLPDPEFGARKDCADYEPPVRRLGAHVAPLGMRFYTGRQFPPEYQAQIFIAEHGSWNRSVPTGYRIGLIRLHGRGAPGYAPFAEGWLKAGRVSGRPVDLALLPDGSMLVSDDRSGVIYRISYRATKRDAGYRPRSEEKISP